jgi:hypothetical protein
MDGAAARRLAVVSAHLAAGPGGAAAAAGGVAASPCAAVARKSLPRFDPHTMEAFIDDMRDLKRQIYDVFKFNPDLLPPAVEALSKGAFSLMSPAVARARRPRRPPPHTRGRLAERSAGTARLLPTSPRLSRQR